MASRIDLNSHCVSLILYHLKCGGGMTTILVVSACVCVSVYIYLLVIHGYGIA